MRTFTRLFSLLLIILPLSVLANVIVHGKVKYPNGTPVWGWPVHVVGDSALANPSTCYQSHVVYTDSLGFYRDTLICNTNMTSVGVWMVNCNGAPLRRDFTLTANQNVESNFTYCDYPVYQCVSAFTWLVSTLNVQFFSGTSIPYNPLTDSIISRSWTFGDGTSLNGNVVNPVHPYAQGGLYVVCLKIRTQSGCESTICKSVSFGNYSCVANFNWERIAGTNRVKFNSTTSTSAVSDSIISRKWKFGDGDSLMGNIISPEHTYAQPGSYTACLSIRTAAGCEKTICKVVILQNTVIACNASFNVQLPGSNIVGQPIIFNSSPSTVAPGDSITQRIWSFGDGGTGNAIAMTHIYTQAGFYTIRLIIQAASGCRDTSFIGLTIIAVPQPHCEAIFTFENTTTTAGGNPALRYIKFNSTNSHGVPVNDSIISRTWSFGDGTGITGGNQVSPVHGYAQSGTYTACLYILTVSGCRDTLCKTVVVIPAPVTCQPRFTTTATALTVVFSSSTSSINAGDSIISRSWTFGDGTGAGNTLNVTHQYAQVGEYQICLTIRTRLGCVSTWCKKIAVINQSGNCIPYFTKEQIVTPLRTMRFNSTAAYSQFPNDSIIERKWEFGDGQTLAGNVINPLHTYAHGGTYTVCLKIRTARCESRWCQAVLVRPIDSTNISDSIQIVNLYPVPVTVQLNAVIFSSHNNVAAELSIYDVYGVKKWSQNKILPQGNSTHNIPTAQLANGPYIFRVTTMYGIKSRNFYKLN